MSPINSKLAVLALASSALAVPYAGHGHGHAKQHHRFFHSGHASGSGTGAPYGIANATGIWGSGTAASTGFAHLTGYATGIAQSSAVAPEAAETDSCTDSVVRVTRTNRVTVTVRASEAANTTEVAPTSEAVTTSEVPSTSVASTSESSSASVSMVLDVHNKGFNRGYHHWSNDAASTSSDAPASTSTPALLAVSVGVSLGNSATSTTASATASSSSAASSSSGSSGKRGLAYNDASLTTCFEGDNQVSWGYNWGQGSSGLSSSFNFVPMLWGTSSTFTSGWSGAASSAISSGATHLMSFNEPDMSSQSNLSPSDAAAAYKTYMMPFAGKAKLGAPAVTNGGGSMGLNWLSAFLDECSGCQIDFVTIHWYESASNSAYFKEQVQNATDISGGKPVWVTEFGCTSGSDSDISGFLEEVMPWMDGQDFVERYSYFMVADGYLVSGSEPSTYGSTYATYTS